jgi:tetratricopeptide (TPR) repeat protein
MERKRKGNMRGFGFVLAIATVALFTISSTAQTPCCCTSAPRRAAAPVGPELEIARAYMNAKEYKSAEMYFILAAKQQSVRKQALEGLVEALQLGEKAVEKDRQEKERLILEIAKLYESNGMWSKSEDSFKSLIVPETNQLTEAKEGFARSLDEQRREKLLSERGEWIKRGIETVGLILAFCLLFAYVGILFKRRKSVEILPFVAPTDDFRNRLSASLAYARAAMLDPAGSSATTVPASLVAGLPPFIDELPELDDLEIGGTKLPLAAISKIWGTPAVEARSGADGMDPVGSGYSVVKIRGQEPARFHKWQIRATPPNALRDDVRDFSYNVLIEVLSAYDSHKKS